MRAVPALCVLLSGCVFRYGPPVEAASDPTAPPGEASAVAAPGVDFAPYIQTFDALHAADPGEDADRRDRLDAARDLARQLNRGRSDPEQAIALYLDRIAAIEARATPMEAPVLVGEGGGGIGEEPLEVPDPRVDPGPSLEELERMSPDEALERARDALAQNDYKGALDLLAPHRDGEHWPMLEEIWLESVDGYVFQERERAGELFRTSRAWPQEARDRATLEVQATLEGLLADYPETTYKSALVRNLQLVQRELPQ